MRNKNLFKLIDTVDFICATLLTWDVFTDSLGVIDYMNYLYVIYSLVKASAVIVLCKKAPVNIGRLDVPSQYGIVLKIVAEMLVFIIAIVDMF